MSVLPPFWTSLPAFLLAVSPVAAVTPATPEVPVSALERVQSDPGGQWTLVKLLPAHDLNRSMTSLECTRVLEDRYAPPGFRAIRANVGPACDMEDPQVRLVKRRLGSDAVLLRSTGAEVCFLTSRSTEDGYWTRPVDAPRQIVSLADGWVAAVEPLEPLGEHP